MPKTKGSKKAAVVEDDEPGSNIAGDALEAAQGAAAAAAEVLTNVGASARELVAPTQDKQATFTQRLRRCFAIDKWWSYVTDFTKQFANLKWVLIFMFAEVVAGSFFAFFYLKFRQVAEFGVLFQDWHTFVLLGVVRAAMAVWGSQVFIAKNMTNVRIVYFALIANLVLGMFMMRPIFYMDCNCTNWWQCSALSSFAGAGEPIMNPFPLPLIDRFTKHRVMPRETPPEFSSSHGSMMLEFDHKSEAHIVKAQAQHHASRAAGPTQSSLAQVADGAGKRLSVGSKGACGDNIWSFYNVVGEGVMFATDLDVCSTKEIDESRKGELKELTGKLRQQKDVGDKEAKMPWITSILWLCKSDELCDYVHLSLSNETHARLCQVKGNPLPQPATSNEDTWFLKDTVKVQNCESDPHESARINDEIFENLEVDEAMEDVENFFEDGCHCDDDQSCRIFHNQNGQDRYWCWVDKARKSICSAKGIQLQWDETHGKFWGEDICRQADCRCSGLGMHPTGQDMGNEHFNEGLLWDNKMNYGSSCKKWHADDKWPWCFTGFDTICPDRHPSSRKSRHSHELPKEVLNMTWQWRSHLPCDKDVQLLHVTRSSMVCENIDVVSGIVMSLLFIFSLPMYIATFQFMSNRCCDHTETEDQFTVEWSDSSSSSSDSDAEAAGSDSDSGSDSSAEAKPKAKAKAKGKKK